MAEFKLYLIRSIGLETGLTGKFLALINIVKQLLSDKSGCQWLRSKGMSELAAYTLEEVYELVDALENNDKQAICSELGDLLYQLMIYAQLAEGAGDFTFIDILDGAIKKQQQRRDLANLASFTTPEEVHQHWEEQKRLQKKYTDTKSSLLDDIPKQMPALIRSRKIQDRVGSVGFDWKNVRQVLTKLKEEVSELEEEISNGDYQATLDELGDVLFTCVNIGRHLGHDAEQALRQANNKFDRRFRYIEKVTAKRQQKIMDMNFAELLAIWEEAKKKP